MIIFFKSK